MFGAVSTDSTVDTDASFFAEWLVKLFQLNNNSQLKLYSTQV
jgi:hypothetical protein